MGWNRSGLITALALMKSGYDPKEAIDLIRARRSPHALCNLDNRHGILRRNVKNFTGIGTANQGRLDIQVNKRKTWAKVGQKLFAINRNDEFTLKMSGDEEI